MDHSLGNKSFTNAKPSNKAPTGRSGSSGGGKLTLESCLREHTKEEVLDGGNEVYCGQCKQHKAMRKTVSFWRPHLPTVLVLTLKRFEFRHVSGLSGAAHREKMDTDVDFPVDSLDLAQFCHVSSQLPGDCALYDLFAVCNHYGRLGFGHYTAAARDLWGLNEETTGAHSDNNDETRQDARWFSFDDGVVHPCDVDSDVKGASAYILFYKKRNS